MMVFVNAQVPCFCSCQSRDCTSSCSTPASSAWHPPRSCQVVRKSWLWLPFPGAAGLCPVGRQAPEALPGAAVFDFWNKALPLTPQRPASKCLSEKGGLSLSFDWVSGRPPLDTLTEISLPSSRVHHHLCPRFEAAPFSRTRSWEHKGPFCLGPRVQALPGTAVAVDSAPQMSVHSPLPHPSLPSPGCLSPPLQAPPPVLVCPLPVLLVVTALP